jgi:hypothetical protein
LIHAGIAPQLNLSPTASQTKSCEQARSLIYGNVMRPRRIRDDPGLAEAIRACGSVRELARRLSANGWMITEQGVSKWRSIPPLRVVDVERATGVPRERLRPDLYR